MARNSADNAPTDNAASAMRDQACPECVLKAAGDHEDEVFVQEFGGDGKAPRSTIAWSVPRARTLVAARPRRPLELSARQLAEQALRRDHTPDHVAHIPIEALKEPGLGFYFSSLQGPDQVEMRYLFLMDGAHRAIWAMRTGLRFKVHVLSEVEQLSCIVSCVVDGHELGPNGVMLASGIGTTDAEAGILHSSSPFRTWLHQVWARLRRRPIRDTIQR